MISTNHEAVVQSFGRFKIPDQEVGNLRLNVMPFKNGSAIRLPEGFRLWEDTLQELMSYVPLQEGADWHYVTINSEFFTEGAPLRREGVHMDGNFCVDPEFSYNRGRGVIGAWSRTRPTWGGMYAKPGEYQEKPDNSHVIMDWELPYDIIIPIATYVSNEKGGILVVSSKMGCQAWEGSYEGNVGDGGSWESMETQLTDSKKVLVEENEIYFMSGVTPHETLDIEKGVRRTLMRVTLNHNYDNRLIGGLSA